ncbi:MAG TPA: DUF6056 family protein [Anaerolineaceae bacterium]|nr:DUF6056 family protein [Anaerolineaceae bacterium]
MKLRTGTLIAAILSPLLALAGLAYLGTFTRLHADDFCVASSMAHLGFWASVSFWYNGWAGRFMYFTASHLISVTGPLGASIFPPIVITIWYLALSWMLVPFLRHAHLPRPAWLALAASGLVLLILFSTTPNLFQSVFWRDGQVNYTFPMIGLTLLGGMILRAWCEPAWPQAAYMVTGFVLALICGGFAEIYDATQVALLILLLALVLILAGKETRHRLTPILGAALVGALLAMVIETSAPGNQVRLVDIGHVAVGLIRIITFSTRNAVYIYGKYLLWNPGWAILSVLAPFLAGWVLDPGAVETHFHMSLRNLWLQSWFRGFILVPVSAFLLAIAACTPVVYGMNAYPDDRTIIVPQGLLVVAAVLSSALLGAGLHRLGFLPDTSARPGLRRILTAAFLAMVMAASDISIWRTVQAAPDYQSYARVWDQRAADFLKARQQGQTEITVYGLNNRFGIGDLEIAPDYWVNQCMAQYYGFSAIRGK